MLHARRIILQPHTNAVRLLHHVAIGDNVSLGIDDHARAQRTLPNRGVALATLPAEEAVKEVIHAAVAAAAVLVIGILP